MDIKLLAEDIQVFGKQVTSFPLGIEETFDELANMLQDGRQRAYYGIGECTPDGILYIAATEEKYEGEAEAYGCESYLIEKGDYLAITMKDWRTKTGSIKQVFENLYNSSLADRSKPSIEIYADDTEMLCMVRIDPFRQLNEAFKTSTDELLALISSFNDEDLNRRSTYGNWTAAQTAAHLLLSDKGMLNILKGRTKHTAKKPDEHVQQIKSDFLNFDTKNVSPKFVRPAERFYQGSELVAGLQESRAAISDSVNEFDLALIYEDFPFPVPGGMTGLELFAFIVYHTQRHIHQIKKIREHSTAAVSTA